MMLTIEGEDNTEIEVCLDKRFEDPFPMFARVTGLGGPRYTFYANDFELRVRCMEVISDNGETESQWKPLLPVDLIFKDGEFAIQENSDDLKWRTV